MSTKKLSKEKQQQLEQNEAANLIEKGLSFAVEKKSILKYFSKEKERTFTIRQPYLGALDLMGKEFISIEISDADLTDEFNAFKKLSAIHVETLCNIVAIAVLDSAWKIKLFKKPLSNYFRWRLTSEKLFQLAFLILQLCNHSDFMNSIRFLRVVQTTSPALIEKEAPGLNRPTV